jgi:hypothetical protein
VTVTTLPLCPEDVFSVLLGDGDPIEDRSALDECEFPTEGQGDYAGPVDESEAKGGIWP